MNPQGGSSGQANANNQNEEGFLDGFPHQEVHLPQQGAHNNRLSTAPPHETPNGNGFLQPVVNLPQQGAYNNHLSTAPLHETPNGDWFLQPVVNLPQQGANNNGVSTAPLHETPNGYGFLQPLVNLPQQGANNNGLSTTPLHETPNGDGFLQPVVNLPQQGDNNNGTSTGFPLHQTPVAPDSNISSSSFLAGSSSNTLNIPRKRSFPDHPFGNFYPGESSSMGQQNTGEPERVAAGSEARANNNVNPHNAEAPIPPPNMGANGSANANIGSTASHAPLQSQAGFYFNGASTHSRQPSLQRSNSVQPTFMSSSTTVTTVNGVIVRTTTPSSSSPCPHPRVDIVIPFYEHPSISTRVPPQGPGGMNHSAAASSSSAQSQQSPQHTSASALPPNFISDETRRNLPPEVVSILDSISNGDNLIFEIESSEPSDGLSLETIMQHMERETFLDFDEDDPKEDKERCPICLEDFENGSEIGKMQSCEHKFHFDCIKQWLVLQNICPVCRRIALETHMTDETMGNEYFYL